MSVALVKPAITAQLSSRMVYPTGIPALKFFPDAKDYVNGSVPALIVTRAPAPYIAYTKWGPRGELYRTYTLQLTILAGPVAGDLTRLQIMSEAYCEAILVAIAYDPTFGNACDFASDDPQNQLETDLIGPIQWGAGQFYFGATMYVVVNETLSYTYKP